MSRPPRIAYPHAIYHVINRFVDRHPFFRCPEDYRTFLEIYRETARTLKVLTFSWCLMPNHFHIVLETPEPCISTLLRRFMTRAARKLNRRHGRTGHLFQDRSKTMLIEDGVYFATANAYVLMNPVRAGLVKEPMAYPWSSASEMAAEKGTDVARQHLVERVTGREFSASDTNNQRGEFVRWLRSQHLDENERIFREGHCGSFLGTHRFRSRVLQQQERRHRCAETRKRRWSDRPFSESTWDNFRTIATGFVAQESRNWKFVWASPSHAARHLAVYLAHSWGGWTYDRIRQAESDRTSTGTYSKIVAAIRGSSTRRAIALKMEARFAEVQSSQSRISAD